MTVYSYVEERYCTRCKQNVGVECQLDKEGIETVSCLHRVCEKTGSDEGCKLRK